MDGKTKYKAIALVQRAIIKANYALNNYREIIWLIGDGRSGTTWISNLINYDKKYREMFEPFHPQRVAEMKFLKPHQYIRPFDSNESLENITRNVISGKFTNHRVDASNRSFLYKGILIKDIFANLLCFWVIKKFPMIKPILLIRNPFSVAISKYKKNNAFWMNDPLDFLNQPKLLEDYLLPFEDVIRKTSSKNNFILNQILIWSIINYIPLLQFDDGAIHVCFYENIYNSPNQEIAKIFHFLNGATKDKIIDIPQKIINRPSRVSGKNSNLLAGTSPVYSWKNELDSKIIDDGFEILKHFRFEGLYGKEHIARINVIKKIQQKSSMSLSG